MNLNRGNNLCDVSDINEAMLNLQIKNISFFNNNLVNITGGNIRLDELVFNDIENKSGSGLLKIDEDGNVYKSTSNEHWVFEDFQSNVNIDIFEWSNIPLQTGGTKSLVWYKRDIDPGPKHYALKSSTFCNIYKTGSYDDITHKPTLLNFNWSNGKWSVPDDYSDFILSYTACNSNLNGLDSNISLSNLGVNPSIISQTVSRNGITNFSNVMFSNMTIPKLTNEGIVTFNTVTSKLEYQDYTELYSGESDSFYAFTKFQNGPVLDTTNRGIVFNNSNVLKYMSDLNNLASSVLKKNSDTITANKDYVTENISKYCKYNLNLNDLVSKERSLSNLGLDLFAQIQYNLNDHNKYDLSNNFELILHPNTKFQFLSNVLENAELDNQQNSFSNYSIGSLKYIPYISKDNLWGVKMFEQPVVDTDVLIDSNMFTRSDSNTYGLVRICEDFGEFDSTEATLSNNMVLNISKYKSSVGEFRSDLEVLESNLEVKLIDFIELIKTSSSNLLRRDSNLSEIFSNIKNDSNYRVACYNNIGLHPISYIRTDDEFANFEQHSNSNPHYSNLLDIPNSLSCFHNDGVFLKRRNCLSEFNDTEKDKCKDNLGLGSIASQNTNDLNLVGSVLTLDFCKVTHIFRFQPIDGLPTTSNILKNHVIGESLSGKLSKMYEFDTNNKTIPGIVNIYSSIDLSFSEDDSDIPSSMINDNTTYTTAVLTNMLLNIQERLRVQKIHIQDIKNKLIFAPASPTITATSATVVR